MNTGFLVWCLLFFGFNLLVAWSDFRSRRVPNKLLLITLLAQGLWLLFMWHIGATTVFGASGWLQALEGFVCGLVLFYPFWRFRAMGAGDVKFIATLFFLLGLRDMIPVLLIGTLGCGLHGLYVAMFRGWAGARSVWRSNPSTRRGVPYAAYLALAAVAWMVWKVSQGGLVVITGG